MLASNYKSPSMVSPSLRTTSCTTAWLSEGLLRCRSCDYLFGLVLSICSVSSRTIMYAVNKEIFFLILAVKDAVLQSAMNLYDKGQPLADQLVFPKLWKR